MDMPSANPPGTEFSPSAFLEDVAASIAEEESSDADLTGILATHILVSSPHPASLENALSDILALAHRRAQAKLGRAE